MGEFKPITTQEEFEARLTERLEQKQRSVEKRFEGYTSPDDLESIKNRYQSQIDKLTEENDGYKADKEKTDGEIAGYKERIAKYETDSVKTRIANEMGLSAELADRLRGETEDELREDAKMLSLFSKRSSPLAHDDPSDSKIDTNDEAYKKLLEDLDI